jgi:hypothetical protein
MQRPTETGGGWLEEHFGAPAKRMGRMSCGFPIRRPRELVMDEMQQVNAG